MSSYPFSLPLERTQNALKCFPCLPPSYRGRTRNAKRQACSAHSRPHSPLRLPSGIAPHHRARRAPNYTKQTRQRFVHLAHLQVPVITRLPVLYLQSFSRLWVEFLLTESAAGESPSQSTVNSPAVRKSSLPSTPTSLSPSPPRGTRRLPSFGSMTAMASSPSLPLQSSPPSHKGKGKDRDLSSMTPSHSHS